MSLFQVLIKVINFLCYSFVYAIRVCGLVGGQIVWLLVEIYSLAVYAGERFGLFADSVRIHVRNVRHFIDDLIRGETLKVFAQQSFGEISEKASQCLDYVVCLPMRVLRRIGSFVNTVVLQLETIVLLLSVLALLWLGRHACRYYITLLYRKIRGSLLFLCRLVSRPISLRPNWRKTTSRREEPSAQLSEQEQVALQLCIACLDRAKRIVVLPCRHLCLCQDCAQRLIVLSYARKCPICRGTIESLMEVFV